MVVASLDDQDEGAEEAIVEVKVNYDYLLSMPINSLTLEKVTYTLPTIESARMFSSFGDNRDEIFQNFDFVRNDKDCTDSDCHTSRCLIKCKNVQSLRTGVCEVQVL